LLGHLYSIRIENPEINDHHLVLLVSGGHTLLVEVKSHYSRLVLGETVDDAAGEAFDKVAKILGLGYPGGAELDRLAKKGDPRFMNFPRAMLKDPSFQFSFSGLKTAVAIYWDRLTMEEKDKQRSDVAASFQEAVVDVLAAKTLEAVRETDVKDVAIAGGVAANSRLRTLLSSKLSAIGVRLITPDLALCTDNAAMIAAAGYHIFSTSGASPFTINAEPSLSLNC
jgi:N6-L-threonylcarbamoyladenine synthase